MLRCKIILHIIFSVQSVAAGVSWQVKIGLHQLIVV